MTSSIHKQNINIYVYIVLYLTIAMTIVNITTPISKATSFLEIENINSISNITDPILYKNANGENPSLENKVHYLCSWNPDGSKILVKPSYNFDGMELSAMYVLNADGTEIKEVVPIINNTESQPQIIASVSGELAQWCPTGDRFSFWMGIHLITDFYVISDSDGTFLRAVGTNFSTLDSIWENASKIPYQRDFSWNPDGSDAIVVIDNQLYRIDQNGDIQNQLTNKSIGKSVIDPMWDHKGNKISFISDNTLWIINRDGTNLKKIEPNVDRLVGWSSDNSKLYYSNYNNTNCTCFSIDNNGGKATKIETITSGDYLAISPEGKILFTKKVYNDGDLSSNNLYIADENGRNQKLLYADENENTFLGTSWSPNGHKISFSSGIINSDGTNKIDIELSEFHSWDPSSSYVGFTNITVTNTDDDYKVCIVKSDGNGSIEISPKDNLNFYFDSWSPDGSRLLIYDENYEVLVVKFNGYDELMHLDVPKNIIPGKEFPIFIKSLSSLVQDVQITLNGIVIGTSNETGSINCIINKSGKYILNASKEGYVNTSKIIVVQNNSFVEQENNVVETVTVKNPEASGFYLFYALISLCIIAFLWRKK